MPKETFTPKPSQLSSHPEADQDQRQKHEASDEQVAFAEQYFLDEQQHWLDSYNGDTEEQPPTRGGTTIKMIKHVPAPKPKPAPVNNPK
ncbi:hypothetical protein O1611_g508 [Lasiodiplodia mahajangana]|uniref:Uncharacterized protein n=1 Tax=Lasiodiplodia mahajangana TaxID=1108764 RepID=A0ACC2K0A5_9PEZI|nr:hypothetical protein O1611_g508 [Lasiodiplodia mahajangana]